MQFQFFGGMPDVNSQQLNQAYIDCQQHPECKNCPLISGQWIGTEECKIFCETGVNKTNERSEETD